MTKCETCAHRIKIKPNTYICSYKKNIAEHKDKCAWYESKEEDD